VNLHSPLLLPILKNSMKFSRYTGVISSLRSSQAFTLIEVIVAMTILALILTSVFQIYTNIATMSKRLELAR
jgi:prepilin-type N-terminal cleavage/methylation domain-containing protein